MAELCIYSKISTIPDSRSTDLNICNVPHGYYQVTKLSIYRLSWDFYGNPKPLLITAHCTVIPNIFKLEVIMLVAAISMEVCQQISMDLHHLWVCLLSQPCECWGLAVSANTLHNFHMNTTGLLCKTIIIYTLFSHENDSVFEV